MILYLLLFFLAGFIQEIFLTSYHRAIATNRIIVASILTSLIAILSLLVVTEVTRKIFDPSMGFYSLMFVFIFAGGKGLGAYLSLKRWQKIH